MTIVSQLQDSCQEADAPVAKGFKVGRKSYAEALNFANQMAFYWGELGFDKTNIYFGGSLRRKKHTVGDLDIVVNDARLDSKGYQQFNDLLHAKGHQVKVRVLGNSHFSVLIDDFLVEFKRSEPRYLGAMLLFVTGPGDYNTSMRSFAKSQGMALNQYGLHDRATQRVIAAEKEEDIYAALGVPYEAPQVRTIFQPPVVGSVPAGVLNKLPPTVQRQLASFVLPKVDSNGKPIPRDFLFNKASRQEFYKSGGRYNIPDTLKLDRY